MRILHLVRAGAALPAWPALVAEQDWVVDLVAEGPRLRRHGAPPLPPGPLGFAELHRLIGAADRVVTW